MRFQEISDIYRELGLGSQIERDEFLKWTFEDSNEGSQLFIVEAPNSDMKEWEADAELA